MAESFGGPGASAELREVASSRGLGLAHPPTYLSHVSCPHPEGLGNPSFPAGRPAAIPLGGAPFPGPRGAGLAEPASRTPGEEHTRASAWDVQPATPGLRCGVTVCLPELSNVFS